MSLLEKIVETGEIIRERDIPSSCIPSCYNKREILGEWETIRKFYLIYRLGAEFTAEGGGKSYVPTSLRYRLAGTIIDKEARFLFGDKPDINITARGNQENTDEYRRDIDILNEYLTFVLKNNRIGGLLVKAAKDCLIGKRVAFLVDFTEEWGVTISALPSLNFCCNRAPDGSLTQFTSLTRERRNIRVKHYVLEGKNVKLTEEEYSEAGSLLSSFEYSLGDLGRIPAVVVVNDGLIGDDWGESDVFKLKDYEAMYSKLNSSDIDAERKSMNPTKYVVDMDANSTENLSTGAGAFWDLLSDQNLEHPSPQVGLLEPNMSYSSTLQSTLDRLKSTGYEQLDLPNITLESLQGAITSGKSLRALYWPLIVRCKEKMQEWIPALEFLANTIIDGSRLFSKTLSVDLPDIPYDTDVHYYFPLPEDSDDEKALDMQEVNNNLMSRRSYMKKWRGLSDSEIDAELAEIAKEREIIEETFSNGVI